MAERARPRNNLRWENFKAILILRCGCTLFIVGPLRGRNTCFTLCVSANNDQLSTLLNMGAVIPARYGHYLRYFLMNCLDFNKMNIFEWIFDFERKGLLLNEYSGFSIESKLNWTSITNIQTLLALQQYVYNCKPRIADFINSHLCLQRCLAFTPSASLWDSSWKDKVSKLHSRPLKPNINTCERDLFERDYLQTIQFMKISWMDLFSCAKFNFQSLWLRQTSYTPAKTNPI